MDNDKKTPDLLEHDTFCQSIYERIGDFSKGTVVSIEGDWGRGKTDLLTRLFSKCEKYRCIWINPWIHQDSIVLETIAKIQEITGELPEDKLLNAALKAVQVSKFGLRTGQVALSIVKPILSPVFKVGADVGASGLDQLKNYLEERKNQSKIFPGDLFRKLIEKLLAAESETEKKRDKVLFFIDDMDRCTPAVQVSLLEQLHTLTQYGAEVVFFAAIDSTVLNRSLRHHYGEDFEGHLYLEKIFTLRLHLPQLSRAELKNLVGAKHGDLVRWLEVHNTQVELEAGYLEDLFTRLGRRGTPRMIERILLKARFLLRGEKVPNEDLKLALLWLSLGQAYPETRRAFLNISSRGKFFWTCSRIQINNLFPPANWSRKQVNSKKRSLGLKAGRV